MSAVDRREVAAIFAGGALGTLARAALAQAFPEPPTAWPWPTFAVNIGAAFLLGYVITRLTERLPLSSYRRPLLGTGLCGGLSTFSTMQVEILAMLDAHAWALAAGYAAASVAGGFAAIQLATALVRRIRVEARTRVRARTRVWEQARTRVWEQARTRVWEQARAWVREQARAGGRR